MKKIAQGAEAIIYLQGNKIIKERIRKKYRHEEIDKRIRKKTTRFESRLLKKASEIVPVPKVLNTCDKAMIIEMEFIKGKKLRDIVDKMSLKERKDVFKRIGKKVAKLHNKDIIHGDLTTSNMLIKEKIYFIDFGLGFISTKVEDKAVDLHLLKQALESKHHQHFKELFDAVMDGYKEEIKDFEILHKRFEKVEARGRYKKRK
ncbi:MAG: KEOPS complex kinase/ATPase Bud32 [Nanoarchaeota archaeon]|nr:KEOPS complex kinase/ATPase Bud32 [Nanoarchaeota archaeon]